MFLAVAVLLVFTVLTLGMNGGQFHSARALAQEERAASAALAAAVKLPTPRPRSPDDFEQSWLRGVGASAPVRSDVVEAVRASVGSPVQTRPPVQSWSGGGNVGVACESGKQGDSLVTGCQPWCAPAAAAFHCPFCKCRGCAFCAAGAAEGGGGVAVNAAEQPRIGDLWADGGEAGLDLSEEDESYGDEGDESYAGEEGDWLGASDPEEEGVEDALAAGSYAESEPNVAAD